MRNPFNHPAMVDISLFFARLTLGLFVLLDGWTNLYQTGVSSFVSRYFVPLWPQWLPEAVARPLGYTVPWLQFLGGLLVVLGLFTRWAGGVVTLLLLGTFVAVVNRYGLRGDEAAPFHTSVVYAAMAFVLAIVGPGRLALDPLYFGGGGPAGKGK